MGNDPEVEFRRELEVFGNEIEEAIQCFYAEQTIQNCARRDQWVYHALNRNAMFWNLTCRALQANAIIVLGRIFDQSLRAHTLKRLLDLATQNPSIFQRRRSKGASYPTQENTQRSSCARLTFRKSAISRGYGATPTSTGRSTTGIIRISETNFSHTDSALMRPPRSRTRMPGGWGSCWCFSSSFMMPCGNCL